MARRFRLPFRIPFFRIFYSTTYTTLYIVELIFLAASPTSLIYEAIIKSAFQYVVTVGGVYILVVLAVLFIYTSRLFKNRTVLAAVGKSHIPVEDKDVPRRVRRLIKGQFERSAVIALECRPRDLSDSECDIFGNFEYSAEGEVGRLVKVDPEHPPWGIVQHPGWSSPDPRETAVTPHVHFMQIIDELPNLLEARAVSLGGQPQSVKQDDCQRTILLSPREYLEMLDEDGVIEVPECAEEFLAAYEAAKFSGRPISEAEFISLTTVFAEVLAGLRADPENTMVDDRLVVEDDRFQSLPLETIEDSASAMSASTRAGQVMSDSDSAATGYNNIGQPSGPVAPAPPFAFHERSGSVLQTRPWNGSGMGDHRPEPSRKSSGSSSQSAISIIQQSRSISRVPGRNR